MYRTLIFCIIFMIFSIQIYSQNEFSKHLLDVKTKSKLDSTFQFVTIKNINDTIISEITYYGKTKNRIEVFYIYESYPAARVRHGLNSLYLIDSTGNKYFYHDINKPDKLENGFISFKHLDNFGECYYYKTDLNKDIPLFLCQDKNDCYSYLSDDKK